MRNRMLYIYIYERVCVCTKSVTIKSAICASVVERILFQPYNVKRNGGGHFMTNCNNKIGEG